MNFSAKIASISSSAETARSKLETMNSSLRIGGWIARWGPWQLFKHSLSPQCNVIRAVSVEVGESTDSCIIDNSTITLVVLRGSLLARWGGSEYVMGQAESLSIPPSNKFSICPKVPDTEFILVVIPPNDAFDGIRDADELSIMNSCGERS